MSRRTLAGLVTLPLLIGLWVAALWLPLPYVVYTPGITVDVLGEDDGREIIEVSGRESFHTGGQLRMTTVYVTQPQGRVNVFEVVSAWVSDEAAVYPYDSVYQPEETDEDAERESSVQMVSSQDSATAVALAELGVDYDTSVEVLNVTPGTPAEGALEVGDVLVEVGGIEIVEAQDVLRAVQRNGAGTPLRFDIVRDGEPETLQIEPVQMDGVPRVGFTPGPGYEFPFDVTVAISDNIGGPSAGLMFSLGIYDTLTPGSLTDDRPVAGTGTIDAEGRVGPIGGIQQKIVGARDDGAELFLVPPDNCADALNAPRGDMRLVRATTMHDAVEAIRAWTADPDADLPACTTEDAS